MPGVQLAQREPLNVHSPTIDKELDTLLGYAAWRASFYCHP
ncbi:MAG: hypothetical protein QOG17_969 [Gammaproteobacteria bacterium]|nr:hypothetical protein [Gammaproteobacteria bacterium]